MGIELSGAGKLAKELQRLSSLRFDAVALKNMTQIYNRGKTEGGTPVDTGELRLSLSQSGDVVGYAKSYAPHVEYGHRTTSGGFVPGQFFFRENVDKQRPVYMEDLKRELRRF